MRLVLLLVLLSALSGCGVVGSSGVAGEVNGRTFLSTEVTEGGEPRDLEGDSRIALVFEGGQVSAHAGCNTMFGGYRVVDGTLVVEDLSMTEMGCPGSLADQDAWLADLLTAEPSLALVEDELTLTSSSTVVTFLDRALADPDRPLIGTVWRVDSLVSGNTVSSTLGGAEASITFHEDGTVDVMPGCNQGSGTYEVGEGMVKISDLVLTRMACSGAQDELESAVLEVLEAGELEVEITAANLTLRAGSSALGLRAG